MPSFGRLTATGAASFVDVSPALANLNFDFALYKLDAPKEFNGVGDSLSSMRRVEAESGTPHITARKLGALFERVLPNAPELIKAYGIRASEICEAAKIKLEDTTAYGSFAPRAGADVTSLWAAATSGSAAIAVHLLACMLARIWEGPEATSIWVEATTRRKQEILADFEENNIADIASLAAAQQELSRTQLAEWDASARAWLRTADRVKRKQQTQVRLVVDNVDATVNNDKDVYESVMHAWKSSLSQMESLLRGIPQLAQHGASLLSLASWHLYPDMVVLGVSATEISQSDSLFPTPSILTVGLRPSETSDKSGISWSLPLAHLRYYGPPVMSARSLNTAERSRLTIDELLLASLGCFIQNEPSELTSIQILSALSEHLGEVAASSKEAEWMLSDSAGDTWLSLLFEAAQNYLQSSGEQHKSFRRLVKLGKNHGKSFIKPLPTSFFGLLRLDRFIRLHTDEEDKIRVLRDVAKDSSHARDRMLIRYTHFYRDLGKTVLEYATALPTIFNTFRSPYGPPQPTRNVHLRWIFEGRAANGFSHADVNAIRANFSTRRSFYESMGETAFKQMSKADQCSTDDERRMQREYELLSSFDYDINRNERYRFFAGDEYSAALFLREHVRDDNCHALQSSVSVTALHDLITSKKASSTALVRELDQHLNVVTLGVSHLKSLKAMAAAANSYKNFPGATVDVRVLGRPLEDVSWMPRSHRPPNTFQIAGFNTSTSLADQHISSVDAFKNVSLSRSETFACISMFESGHHNLNPKELEDVMAVASGDSIYVAAALLSDPAEDTDRHKVKRVMGNVGRPGIALLSSPEKLMVKKPDLNTWNLVNRDEFDGKREDCFGSTTLHLSFTGATFPMDSGEIGARDANIYKLESLTSVHERGEWIADIDILKTYSKKVVWAPTECSHTQEDEPIPLLTCIDNWYEFVDLPDEASIVRAHRNWQARLAATAIGLARSHRTLVLPCMPVCWKCIGAKIEAQDDPVILVD
jgi:hypothetical protein